MGNTEVNAILGSLTNNEICDWSDGDIVFVNCTCFHAELLEEMQEMAKRLKRGSYFISLTYDIVSPEFEVISELRLPMSW